MSRTFILAGDDADGLAAELASLGAEVVRVEGIATRESLDAAGLDDAHTLVLTEMDDASAIPVAKEANTEVRIVTYSHDSLPEFARGQADLAIDPALLSPDVVADELANGRAEPE